MPLRNGDHGYGSVTKTLHWAVFLLMAAQFAVGYVMEVDDHGRNRGRGGEATQAIGVAPVLDHGSDDRGGGGGRRSDDGDGGDGLLPVHITLGILILVLGAVRVGWRRATPLPPWAPQLSPTDQRLSHWLELSLYTLTFAIPLTGLLLVVGDDDLLPLHVVAHVVFFVVLAAHLAMALARRTLPRML